LAASSRPIPVVPGDFARTRARPRKCGGQSVPSARGQNSLRRGVRSKPVNAAEGEQHHEPRACTTDPALDCPYRDLADRSRLLVGEARRANEKQDLALAGGQLRKRRANFLEFQPAVLLGRRFQAIEVATVGVFDFAASLPIVRPDQVAKDREQPGVQVRPQPKRVDVGQGAQERFGRSTSAYAADMSLVPHGLPLRARRLRTRSAEAPHEGPFRSRCEGKGCVGMRRSVFGCLARARGGAP
jgi:hypothetical protein